MTAAQLRLLLLGALVSLAWKSGAGAGDSLATEAGGWAFRVIHARTRALPDGSVLGVENDRSGRGFYRSDPIRVKPGARYSLSVACRTERAPPKCALARVFWYQGPDRGRPSALRRYDDTTPTGGTTEWVTLAPPDALTVPADATVAVLRLESSSPETREGESEQVALAGRTIYQVNWHTLLKRKGVTFRNGGDWLDPAEFARYRLVILCNAGPGRRLSSEGNDAIQLYLERGGHVILTITTPYKLAGGKDVSALDWLGANHCRYGHLGEEFSVTDNSDALTRHLHLGDSVYTTSGKVAGLRLPEARKGLVGQGAYCFIVSRPVGRGRVTFFGNSPPPDTESQPRFSQIIDRALADVGLESETQRAAERFRVWFKDVVFAETEE